MMAYTKYISTPEAVWFLSVPNNWRATKMRELFSERNTKVSDKNYPALSVGKMGVVPQLDTAVKSDNGDNRKLICQGDFAINSRSDRKGAGGVSVYDGSASLIITVLKPHHELNGRFYHYLLRSHYFSEEFYRNGHGLVSDLWTTKWDTMRNIYIPVPPREEQNQIVRYLDWQISQINKLIKGKRKKKSVLMERKKAIILEVLTGAFFKGNETRPIILHRQRKICVPSHWETKPLCAIAKIKSISNNTDLELLSVYLDEGVVPFSSRSEKRTNATSKDLSKYQRVDPGDFVMNNQQAWRGSVGVSDYTGIVSPAYVVLSLDETLSRGFANYLLRSPLMVEQYLVGSKGVGSIQRNVYWPTIKRAAVIVPPMEEQLEIEQIIRKQTEMIDSVCKAIDSEIELLQEMKNKLISDVVTGQIDVRGIEIPEYEYVEETIDDNIDVDEDTSQEVEES